MPRRWAGRHGRATGRDEGNGIKQLRPARQHRALLTVRSLPRVTSLTAIEGSSFGEERNVERTEYDPQ